MENDELELETPQPDQQEKELELEGDEPDAPKAEGDEPQGGDPLDKLERDALLAETKKYRAIIQRHKGKKEEPKGEPKTPEKPEESKPSDFLKKSDFELANQKKAIRMATAVSEQEPEEAKKIKEDLLENWDKVRQFYTPRRGKDTPEDVLEDIKDAYTVFNTRRKPKEEKPDVSDLTTTKSNPTGNAPSPKIPKKNPPNFNIPKKPSEWY